MLKLIYDWTEAGAPEQYRDTADDLVVREDTGDRTLQSLRKADPGFAAPSDELAAAIDGWLERRTDGQRPVIVMVHGYLYDPRDTPGGNSDSPFASVYATPSRATSYRLSRLPLVGECKKDGNAPAETAIAYCYKSESTMAEFNRAGWSNSYQYAVFDQAPLAARGLAAVLAHLGTKDGVRVRMLAHSLGTRTTSQAIRLLRARMPANLDRIVMLDGSEFCIDALASFTNCDVDVFNVTNRSDSVLNLGANQMCHPFRTINMPESCVIGRDGFGVNARWLDLQLDNQALVTWFGGRNAPDGVGYTINALAEEDTHSTAWLDHWACYTNDGNRQLVSDLLSNDVMTIANFTSHGVPGGTDSPMFGKFTAQAIPIPPQTLMDRRRMSAQASAVMAGGGSG